MKYFRHYQENGSCQTQQTYQFKDM